MKHRRISNLILVLSASVFLCACGTEKTVSEPVDPIPEESPLYAAEETAASSFSGKIIISEVMPKNKATVQDSNGEFTDWVELHNISDEDIDLSGWTLDAGKGLFTIDSLSIPSGEYGLIFTKVASEGSVELFDMSGSSIDSFGIVSDKSDRSLVLLSDGTVSETLYPTPGYPNTDENYDYLQSLHTVSGPLEISEVSVENFEYRLSYDYECMDWVEIKNISDETYEVSGWYLTDDLDDPTQYKIPDKSLFSGESMIVFCDKDLCNTYASSCRVAPFSLDSDNDRIYLISPDGVVADYTPLKGIPYGMTFGRSDDGDGFYYFEDASPADSNEGNMARRVAETPVALSKDGVFDKGPVTVELSSDSGDIYYTTDGTTPTEESEKYEGPFEVCETCIVKAVTVKEGCINSQVLTLSYFIDEGTTLPVVSVVSSNHTQFKNVYDNAQASKGKEIPGVISYYDDNGSFTIGAGIKMHGYSTLVLPKKNMSFKFRGCYGQDTLNYDIFGDGGTTEFSNLLLRAGGDQRETIVKNEVCLNLAAQYSDSLPITRSKYVVVYVDGEYLGIYALMEKPNEQWFADTYNVQKSSVIMEEEPVYDGNPFREEVLDPVLYGNMEDPAAYSEICKVLDIDSLIDWTLIQGFCGNWDLASGNLRYAKSDDTDGKWKFVLYDFDQAFLSPNNCFVYTLSTYTVGAMNQSLLDNDEYRTKFLDRASSVLKNELSAENVWAEYERLAGIIDEEVKIEAEKNADSISYESWQKHLDEQKDLLLEDYDWYTEAARSISRYCSLSKEEELYWFGDI